LFFFYLKNAIKNILTKFSNTIQKNIKNTKMHSLKTSFYVFSVKYLSWFMDIYLFDWKIDHDND